MEICDFAFHRPTSLAEATELGLRFGPNARFLAGGTELLPDLKQHKDETQHLIDLRSLDSLRSIRIEGEKLRIGATATLSEIEESPQVLETFPALAEAIRTMAAVQIRNRGTIGGNFCGGVPSADTPPICIAAGAEVRIVDPKGERSLPAESFFLGPRRVALEPGELLAEIRIPVPPEGSGASYQRFALRKATALAVVGVAARIDLAGGKILYARLALGAVAPVPLLASCAERLRGERPSEEIYAEVADAAAEEARPIADLRGTLEFRRDLVRVLTVRALRAAVSRADRTEEGVSG